MNLKMMALLEYVEVMNMCASCQCYIESEHDIIPKSNDEEAMLSEALYLANK